MSAPYEFVNVTKSQYYRCPSSLVRHGVIEQLLKLFKLGTWDVNDIIVHGYYLLQANVDNENDSGVYYNRKSLTSI